MKNFREIRIYTLILIVFASLQSMAQIKSYPVNSTEIDPSSDGFYYGLPKHTIRVDITVKKIEKFKGKYSDYTTKLLGITDYITKDGTTYEIRDARISLITGLDSANIYYAQLPAKFENDRTFLVNMLENGLISNVSVLDEEQTQRHNPDKPPFIELLKPVLIEKVDTIIRRVSIDTIKVLAEIFFIFFGNLTDFNDVHVAKADAPIEVISSEISILVNPVDILKAPHPIFVTLSGISIVFKLVQ